MNVFILSILFSFVGILLNPSNFIYAGYVLETYAGIIRKYDVDYPISDNVNAVLSTLDGPSGISFDSSDNLYIADRNNRRIRKIKIIYILE